jgi:hypothetical protein
VGGEHAAIVWHPMPVSPLNPPCPTARMPMFGPSPETPPNLPIHSLERLCRNHLTMIVCPTANNRVMKMGARQRFLTKCRPKESVEGMNPQGPYTGNHPPGSQKRRPRNLRCSVSVCGLLHGAFESLKSRWHGRRHRTEIPVFELQYNCQDFDGIAVIGSPP